MLLIVYLLKVSACLVLFYGLYYFLFRRFTFHRLNRIYLLLTLLLSFIIPLVELEQKRIVEIAPVVADAMPQKEMFEEKINTIAAEPDASTSDLDEVVFASENNSWITALTWEEWSIGVYGIGLFIALMVLARRLWKIAQLSRQRQNDACKEWVEVSESFTAASFFGLIFMNSQALTEEEKKQVLLHEQMHAQLFHSVDVLLVELCKVILWFHPTVYLCKKSLVEIHEYEVDERLAAQVGAKTYAHLILKLATHSSYSLVHSFGKHPVTNRIQFLFQKPTTAMKKSFYAFVLTLILAGVFAFAPRKEVLVYKEKPEVTKKTKEVPVKVYPLRVHNKHVWHYFEQQKKAKPKYFGDYNLTLNDLCVLPSGLVYYLVNPNSLNLKDLATVNQRISKSWKMEVVVTEQVVDKEGKLSKIGLAVKNLRTNQLSAPEIIDMTEARELGKQGAYLDIDIRNPYSKPQIALVYGDKSLTISRCSNVSKDHQAYGVVGEMSTLKISKDKMEYTVYPDKANLPTFQKVSQYFKKEGFDLMITNEKYDTNQQLLSFDVGLANDKNEIVKSSIVLSDLRHYVYFGEKFEKKHRFDEPLILRANKYTGKVELETTTEWGESLRKKGHLKPFVPEAAKVNPQKTAQNELLPDENSYTEFSRIVQEMHSKDIFFKRVEIKSKIDGIKEMLIFARGGEGTAATGLVIGMGKFPIYYLDGIRVQEGVVKSLKPSHIKKVDILEPEYNRYPAFVKKHKLDVKNEKIVWMERREFDFQKLPAPNINRKLSLRLESADTIRTFLPANELGKNPLVFINGEEFPASVLTRVDPTKFGMSYVAKPNDPKAISKYGVRALDGVVDIKTIDDCFFKTEQERKLAVENMRKILNTANKRFSKCFLKNNEGNELMMIVVRGFVYNEPFVAGFPKNTKTIYLMDGKPVDEEQIEKYEGKFQSATRWKKTTDNSKMQEKYGDLIASYDGGIDLKTTR